MEVNRREVPLYVSARMFLLLSCVSGLVQGVCLGIFRVWLDTYMKSLEQFTTFRPTSVIFSPELEHSSFSLLPSLSSLLALSLLSVQQLTGKPSSIALPRDDGRRI